MMPQLASAVQKNADGASHVDKENMRGSELRVEAIWHEQVHQSRVSFLSVSEDGETLFTACDAAAPRPIEGPDFPAAAVCTKDGGVLQAYPGGGLHNIRLILSAEPEQLCCVSDQGDIVRLTPLDDNAAASVEAQAAVGSKPPGGATPGAAESNVAALADEHEGQEAGSVCSDKAVVAVVAADSGKAIGPEFLAATGYRGVRAGYLFRSGSKGLGYYRKDVVRIYAPMEPRVSTTGREEAVPATAAASLNTVNSSVAASKADAADTAAAIAPSSPNSGNNVQQAQQGKQDAGGGSDSRNGYLQRLLRAPPGLSSAITTWDGSLLITASLGSRDKCIRVWQLPAQTPGKCSSPPPQPTLLHTLVGHAASVLSLALNPQGTLLFSGSHDYTIRAWSTKDWSCVRVLKGHGGGVRALAVSPDGGTLYSAAGDNTLRAWSTRLGVCLRTLHGRHEETTWPCCMAMSPDGELLASGSNGLFGGSTIKVFQTRGWQGREAGACLATLAQLSFDQKGSVSALAFSRDGRLLYSGASDGTLAAWRLKWVDPAAAGKGAGLRRGFF